MNHNAKTKHYAGLVRLVRWMNSTPSTPRLNATHLGIMSVLALEGDSRSRRVAERLGISDATFHASVARLDKEGLVWFRNTGHNHAISSLTAGGRHYMETVERFLTDKIT